MLMATVVTCSEACCTWKVCAWQQISDRNKIFRSKTVKCYYIAEKVFLRNSHALKAASIMKLKKHFKQYQIKGTFHIQWRLWRFKEGREKSFPLLKVSRFIHVFFVSLMTWKTWIVLFPLPKPSGEMPHIKLWRKDLENSRTRCWKSFKNYVNI